MVVMKRRVEPEILDELPPDDSRAVQSRRDLHRVNWFMGHAHILTRALHCHWVGAPPQRLLELGGGDGTFLLRLARRWAERWPNMHVQLLDRQDLVRSETRAEFEKLGWRVEMVRADLLTWLDGSLWESDLTLANLFLHHFQDDTLQKVFERLSGRTRLFVACDPERSDFPERAAQLLWLLGCNAVTRHDARVSVRAGFSGKELTQLWPEGNGWILEESRAGLFSHLFVAARADGPQT
jgi:hypothetical protein